jgi:hypothetical protein
MGRAYNLKKQAYSSGDLSAKFTVTQNGHPMNGKSFEFLVFEEATVKTDAKSSAIKGNGPWAVAYTMTMSESATCEIGGVPAEERLRFIDFIGNNNGAGATEGTLELTARLPWEDADSIKLFQWKWENCADFTFNREGSTETATGPFVSMTVNDIDPLAQVG